MLSDSEFLVAETGGSVVGFSQLLPESCEVRAVYVDPDAQGGGVGSALLERIESVAREMGLEEVELRSSLNAVSFYSNRGCKRVQDTTHRLADGSELPCVLMRKRL